MSVFIIAEAGVNHNGSIDMAKQLIDVAVEAGADAVKFQTFKTECLVTKDAKQADYQVENTGVKESQFEMLKRLELSEEAHRILIEYCCEKNIEFMSTPFDNESIDLLAKLAMKTWKIPSGELLSIPYLRKIAKLNRPTVLSTGMAKLEEVKLSMDTLIQAGLDKKNLTILHANSAYPTPYKDVNLRAMDTIAKYCDVQVGLSDHSLGIEVPIAAVALGAVVIEKHFTLDKKMIGPDHKASLEPVELKAMVEAIRNIEKSLGSGDKLVTTSENDTLAVARKRIVAAQPITKGEMFSEENISLKRATKGVYAQNWDIVVQSVADRNYEPGDGIIV